MTANRMKLYPCMAEVIGPENCVPGIRLLACSEQGCTLLLGSNLQFRNTPGLKFEHGLPCNDHGIWFFMLVFQMHLFLKPDYGYKCTGDMKIGLL